MKVTSTELDKLREAIRPLDTEDMRNVYRAGQYPRAERTKDVNVRYRWDLFHAAGCYVSGDYKDDHIDTALRSIVPAALNTVN